MQKAIRKGYLRTASQKREITIIINYVYRLFYYNLRENRTPAHLTAQHTMKMPIKQSNFFT